MQMKDVYKAKIEYRIRLFQKYNLNLVLRLTGHLVGLLASRRGGEEREVNGGTAVSTLTCLSFQVLKS